MAESKYKQGMTETGGPGGGGGGSPSWRYGSDMGLKGLRPRGQARQLARTEPVADYPTTEAARGSYMRGVGEEAGQTSMKGTPTVRPASRADYLKGQVEQSIQDRGGYPTRGGKPMMTKMQQRMEARKAAAEAEPVKKREPFKFNKGGMVKGHCREYGK